eukprot:scaffold634_cov185-Ochromonas_danica.AAC.10
MNHWGRWYASLRKVPGWLLVLQCGSVLLNILVADNREDDIDDVTSVRPSYNDRREWRCCIDVLERLASGGSLFDVAWMDLQMPVIELYYGTYEKLREHHNSDKE